MLIRVILQEVVALIVPHHHQTCLKLHFSLCEYYKNGKAMHPEYVFTYGDKPVVECNTKAWRKALKRTGIINFRWHDLPHTWAS